MHYNTKKDVPTKEEVLLFLSGYHKPSQRQFLEWVHSNGYDPHKAGEMVHHVIRNTLNKGVPKTEDSELRTPIMDKLLLNYK